MTSTNKERQTDKDRQRHTSRDTQTDRRAEAVRETQRQKNKLKDICIQKARLRHTDRHRDTGEI